MKDNMPMCIIGQTTMQIYTLLGGCQHSQNKGVTFYRVPNFCNLCTGNVLQTVRCQK